MRPRLVRAKMPLAPVLFEPRAAATQETQILYGHCAEVVEVEGKWLRVRGADGYEGWTHQGFYDVAESPGGLQWGWDTEGELSLGCRLRDSLGNSVDLPLGAILDGGSCIDGRSVALTQRRDIFPTDASAIVATATGLFQGTYYQWGGITPWGADCSGLVQTSFALHGVKLLRDAWQQATQGVLVDGGLDAFEAADLLFFSDREDGHITHVGLGVARNHIVHLALGRGGYSLESFDRPDEYSRTLMSNFRFARRILARD